VNENLAKARTAARADQPAPTWRLIITDSESPSGLAPVCSGERSDALHMIDDYPGGPQRDEDGVYDCCPYPQIETYSTVWAEYLVELLNADAGEKASVAAPTATPDLHAVILNAVRAFQVSRRRPGGYDQQLADHLVHAVAPLLPYLDEVSDFFQPGRTYTEPGDTTDWRFRCDAITTHPEDGGRTALGWRHFRGEWSECAYGEDDFEIHQIADAIGTPACPLPALGVTDTNRRARLLHEIAFDGGRWKSGDVVRWYETQGLTGLGTRAARHDLAVLRDSGALTQHDEKGVRFYTLNSRKDVRP